MSLFGSRRLDCGSGRLSVEKRREKRVAGSDVVDALGFPVREARMELNEFRGSGEGVGGGDWNSSSSGVVRIIVTGASGEFWKMVDVLPFRRFKERGSWKEPSDTYWTTPGLYLDSNETSSSFSFFQCNEDRRFLEEVVVTERMALLSSSSSLVTMRGIEGGSRDGAGLFHTTSTNDWTFAAS